MLSSLHNTQNPQNTLSFGLPLSFEEETKKKANRWHFLSTDTEIRLQQNSGIG